MRSAMFKPFMIDNEYLYRSDNVRALHVGDQGKGERSAAVVSRNDSTGTTIGSTSISRECENGCCRTLEEELKAVEKRSYTYKDLLDLFDTSVKRFPTRVAMRIERNGRKEQYTFEDVKELTLRAAGFFAKNGIAARQTASSCFRTTCPSGE